MSSEGAMKRVGWIAQNTLREAARQRVAHVVFAVAVGFVVGARWLQDFNFGASELRFLSDCGLGAVAFFGAMLTVAATANLFFAELERRTALTLLAKPVRRAEYLLGKFFGVAALIAVFCAVLGCALAATLAWREYELSGGVGERVNHAGLAAAIFLQGLKLCVLSAFTLLVASYASTQLFTMAAGFVLLAICQLQPLAHSVYARADTVAGRALAAGLSWVLPNFQVFAIADAAVVGETLLWGDVARVALYAGIYGSAAAGLAVVSFNRREI